MNHCGFALSRGSTGFGGNQAPDLVKVDSGLELLVTLEMEVSLSLLTEVTGMAKYKVVCYENALITYYFSIMILW